MMQVEADVIVPVQIASDHAEFAARTLRPKIHRNLKRFLVPLSRTGMKRDSLGLCFQGVKLDDLESVLDGMKLDRSVLPAPCLRGGTSEARKRLSRFMTHDLPHYREGDQPRLGAVSHLSPYLHFGQISPVEVALAISRASVPETQRQAFLEQLIVRRELSCNFTEYTPAYDRFEGLPTWSRSVLRTHERDPRPYRYSARQFEEACTHDLYWNAAMLEMRSTGYLHNRMRMYWGKMILNWSVSPRQAFRTALRLNNRYFVDGRDPTSFASVGWLFGLHDRPWPSRPVFGTVRSMTRSGLERQIDTQAYLRSVEAKLSE